MALFATEFPIIPIVNRAQFAAEAIAWVKGIRRSTLFDEGRDINKDDDEATLRAPTGETLTLKECKLSDGFVIGARHEIPDAEGRLWLSEVVMTTRLGVSALRSRSQCVVTTDGAMAETPRKPYIIKMVISNGWGGSDDSIVVQQEPILIDDHSIDLASKIILGRTKCQLPFIYISRLDNDEIILDEKLLDSLAYSLGGLAHVVIEPSRAFSFKLMNAARSRNPYNGTIGFCANKLGVVRRYAIGNSLRDATSIVQAIIYDVTQFVTNRRPRLGWEWEDLLRESNKQARRIARSDNDTNNALLSLYDLEIREKDQTILNLRDQIDSLQNQLLELTSRGDSIISDEIIDGIGQEIYDGEYSDRIRLFLKEALPAHLKGVDQRSRQLVERIVAKTRWSGLGERLEDRIKNAGKDSGKADARLGDILHDIGFEKRQSGHPVYVPGDQLFGLSQHTLSCTPSDARSGKNAAAQIIRDLGLNRFKGD